MRTLYFALAAVFLLLAILAAVVTTSKDGSDGFAFAALLACNSMFAPKCASLQGAIDQTKAA